MIQLKSLELQGFKSFPDKTVINFSSGITAIVGPNGSGKSNISDAIRWAMGETSSKSLRGTKMEDVIFIGTKTRKPVGFAQVTLNFDNADGDLPVEFAEVSISRRYYRSGESEYYINRNQVRLKDIQDLLRDTGLGKDGYSIISQGAVTQIITAKSSDRRTIFEEAAGIARFKYKKEESERKLSQTEDNIVRLTDILAELSERLPVLERQSAKARKYLEYYGRKKLLDVGLWLFTAESSEISLKKAEETLGTLRRDLEKAEKDLEQSEKDTVKLEEEIRELTVKTEELRSQIADSDRKIQEKNAEILVLKNDISYTEQSKTRIGILMEEYASKETETAKRLEDARKALEEKLSEIRKLEEEYIEISEGERHLSEEEKAALEKTAALRNAILEYNEKLSGKKAEAAEFSALISSDSARRGSIAAEKEALAGTLKNWENTLSEKETSLKEIADGEASCKNMLVGCEMKAKLQKEKADKAEEDVRAAETDLAAKQNRLRILEDLEKNSEGFSGSVQKVISDGKNGILRGICGTVASLIKVDENYAVAVETALGAAIQNIVTEDEKSAKNAIFRLKNERAGRATFLPVDTIKGRSIDKKTLKTSLGFEGIAADLVTCDKKYRNIIDNLLGRTLVVSDLDEATETAKMNGYAYKTVTVDGQTVNAGGSLTGGSVGRNIGVLSRKNEIETLKKATVSLEEKLSEKKKAATAAREEAQRASIMADGIKDEIAVKEKERLQAELEISHAKEFYDGVKSQLAALENEEREAEKRILSQKEKSDRISKESKEYETELSKIRDDISEAEKASETLKSKQDAVKEKLNAKNIEIVTARNEAETIKTGIERFSSERLSGVEKKKAFEEELAAEEAKAEDFRNKISAAETEIGNTHKEKSEKEELLRRSVSERTEKEAQVSKLRDSDREIYALREGLVREIEKTEQEKISVSEKLGNMQNHLWDEYEITPTEARENFTKPENPKEAEAEAFDLKNKIRALGSVNVESIEEYTSVKERFDAMNAQVTDLTDAKAKLEKIIEGLMRDMEKLFETQFEIINIEFERVFKQLFNGGEAKLTLVDGENMLDSGIDIYAAPPGKVIKNMTALSGGEQSLTAIALYFAILKIHPAPFCLLDEIEAALDDVNVSRFAEYLTTLSNRTQLIAITHRRGTMEIADRLYGVTMREKGVSRVLTINVDEIEKNL